MLVWHMRLSEICMHLSPIPCEIDLLSHRKLSDVDLYA